MKHLLLIALLLATGCATYKPAVKKEIETTRNYDKSFDTVWASIIKYISSNGMNIKATDKTSGLITFERVSDAAASQQYFDCGATSGFSMANIPVYGAINANMVVTKNAANKTGVAINMSQNVSFQTGQFLSEPKECFSNGEFEKKVLNSI